MVKPTLMIFCLYLFLSIEDKLHCNEKHNVQCVHVVQYFLAHALCVIIKILENHSIMLA